jgi:hypothetical protein
VSAPIEENVSARKSSISQDCEQRRSRACSSSLSGGVERSWFDSAGTGCRPACSFGAMRRRTSLKPRSVRRCGCSTALPAIGQ